MSQETMFRDAIDELRERGSHFAREAYVFVVAALGETVRALPADRLADPERRHLSGRELSAGIVRIAREEFGALAPMVFREWGVQRNEDIGTMVFELVEAGQLSARPEDTVADFQGGPDLLTALAGKPPAPRAGRDA
ncbi:MAG: Minf_1886 family protein [Candidatus Eisenbacteria bacterium]